MNHHKQNMSSSTRASASRSHSPSADDSEEIQPLLNPDQSTNSTMADGDVKATAQEVDHVEEADGKLDDIHDETAAQLSSTKLSHWSWPSIQLYFFFFIAYCSMYCA